ncbi:MULTISPECIES: carboxyl-terminal processing protease CtpB [unclassified Leptolyngbya]|uniref:carboxyl-terminal processing protease CtpB n=1 Tax=unclassified Leptolyngbya TaxID=2650499 RepID=UPI0016879327|nr:MULTISPECIES: carboxyl-terminal processing protease CtpB [unclassified Leptolyngbya]MBD1911491.1 S41 family peptidase [Leptolyngbya sp. FACHB-8]MBD2155269.1 S41 family peptidase [Leptolyngbya sp. FACHB-16]
MPQSPRFRSSLHPLFLGSAAAAGAALSIVNPLFSTAVQASLEDSPKAVLDEAWQIVNRSYVDSNFNQVNWQETRQELLSREYSSRNEAYAALRRALQQLDDPYTRFMTPQQFEALTNQTSGELSGVGIRLSKDSSTNALVIVEPIPNSPAAEAGVQPGDRILFIDGAATDEMTLEEASERIRGEEGKPITLHLSRNGGNGFDVILTRARIELTNVTYNLRQERDMKVGYIRLTEFSAHADEQMQEAIQNLSEQGADGYVLDLRGNPGGLVDACLSIARMWIQNGTLVRIVDRVGTNESALADNSALTRLPLVVLVDGNSASSSEILTGALKDNGRATVVGSQTFGKALVQSVHELSDGSGLAVTISHYYTPDGTDISHRGITPDVPINLTEAQQRRLATEPNALASQSDPQYTRAISVLHNDVIAWRNNPDNRVSPSAQTAPSSEVGARVLHP